MEKAIHDSRLDYLALPSYNVADSLRISLHGLTHLIETEGVPHHFTADYLRKIATRLDIPANHKYNALLIGGDVPDNDNKNIYHILSAEEMVLTAQHLNQVAEEDSSSWLISNSNRTGSRSAINQIDLVNAHKAGDPIDYVSQAFEDNFHANHQFFDYKKGESSKLEEIMAKVLATGGKLYVTGDSTSMVSQAVDCLLPGQVYVVKVSSMNQMHKQNVSNLYLAGRVNVVELDLRHHRVTNHPIQNQLRKERDYKLDADLIAEKLDLFTIEPAIKNK